MRKCNTEPNTQVMMYIPVVPAAFKTVHAQIILHHTKLLRQNAMMAGIVSFSETFYWLLFRVVRVPASVDGTYHILIVYVYVSFMLEEVSILSFKTMRKKAGLKAYTLSLSSYANNWLQRIAAYCN